MASYIKDIQLDIQTGTNRTLYCTWQCTKASDTKDYSIKWCYATGDEDDDTHKSIWFVGAVNTSEYLQNTWTAPENATAVKINIKANAKEGSNKQPLFTSGWTSDGKVAGETGNKQYVFKEVTVTTLKLIYNLYIGIQTGTDRTFYITWKGKRASETDHYAVKWYYDSGDSVWFSGQDTSVDVDDPETTYSLTYTPPDNSKRVKVNVKAIAKTRSIEGVESPYFVDSWSTDRIYELKAPTPKEGIVTNAMIGIQVGTASDMYASWTFAQHAQTENYTVKWYYANKSEHVDGGWLFFEGETSDVDIRQSTWTPPEDAVKVKFSVRANPKTHFVNGVEVPYYTPGWSTAIFFALVPDKPKDYLVNDVTVGLQTGTTDTYFASWTCSKSSSQVENYTVRWSYSTGDGIWFVGNESDVDIKQSTYTPPANAQKIKLNVKANPKTFYSNGKETTYFIGKWSSDLVYRIVEKPKPETPSTPTVSINGFGLTAEVNTSDEATELIEFEIVKDDKKVIHTGTAWVNTGHAEIYYRVSAGSEYKVRCRGVNQYNGVDYWNTETLGVTRKNDKLKDVEYSDWSDYSENVGTQPVGTVITEVTTRWSTMGVRVDWTPVSGAETYEIQYSVNPMYFGTNDSEVSSITIDAPTSHAEILGLETGRRWAFRIRVTNANGSSGWSKSYNHILGLNPSAPTTWSETASVVVGDPARLFWVHNSQDGSSQNAAEVELVIDGNTTVIQLTTETNYVFATNGYSQGAALKWRVRTKGVTDTFSPWSAQRIVALYSPPTLEMVFPEYVYSYPITIDAIAAPNSQTAISYYLEIIALTSHATVDETGRQITIKSGSAVFQKYYLPDSSSPNNFSTVLGPGDVILDNNHKYMIRLSAGMNSGLSAKVSKQFWISWDGVDYIPNANIRIERPTLKAVIRPYCEDESGQLVPGVILSVYRRSYDGELIELATDLDNTKNVYIADPHPALDYARYRIVAMDSDTGHISYYDTPGIPIGEPSIVIQWNEEWSYYNIESSDEMQEPDWSGSMVKLPYNVDIQDNYSPDVNFVNYIGRSHPVSYYGTQHGVTATWNTSIPAEDVETIYSLRRLAMYQGDVYVREPSGVGYWAQVIVSFSKNHLETTIPVTLSVTRVEGGK